jgi:UTP--glucose-1-phosphate uridylyltransferase
VSILNELDAETREVLSRYSFDAARFAMLQRRVADGGLSPASNVVRGRLEPPRPEDVTRMPEPDAPGWRAAHDAGMDALRRGAVAMAVLNGGMATRFGGVVKGIVEALDGRSFLEWKLHEAGRVARAAGAAIPCVVMNSFATDDATRAFLAGLGERGAGLPEPRFFAQFVSLRLNPDGSLFRDDQGRPSLYAPGHGDFGEALRASGIPARRDRLLDWLRGQGVRLLMLSNVDNLGARVDPVVVGMHRLGGRPMTVELAAKRPGDAGGAPARLDGRLMVIEGFRFPPDFDQDRIQVFNTNSFVFDLDVLDQDYPLSWFYVVRQVDGRSAVQLERLVGELSSFIPATYLEVPRTGPRGRFFPIKTPADLEESRPALREMLAASVTG